MARPVAELDAETVAVGDAGPFADVFEGEIGFGEPMRGPFEPDLDDVIVERAAEGLLEPDLERPPRESGSAGDLRDEHATFGVFDKADRGRHRGIGGGGVAGGGTRGDA